jgi:hypothetical protein
MWAYWHPLVHANYYFLLWVIVGHLGPFWSSWTILGTFGKFWASTTKYVYVYKIFFLPPGVSNMDRKWMGVGRLENAGESLIVSVSSDTHNTIRNVEHQNKTLCND